MSQSETAEYKAWSAMKARCYNPHNPRFPRYGARGITVCEKWKHSFVEFINDIGHKPFPGASIDRINNDGNYEPGNVHWAAPKQQANNRSTNVTVEVGGVTRTQTEWARDLGMAMNSFKSRVRRGWPKEKLLMPKLSDPYSRLPRKLTSSQVDEIRALRSQGYLLKEIAKAFSVTTSMVCLIVNRKARTIQCG